MPQAQINWRTRERERRDAEEMKIQTNSQQDIPDVSELRGKFIFMLDRSNARLFLVQNKVINHYHILHIKNRSQI